MTARPDTDRRVAQRWSKATLIVFAMIGTGFGTWLSRLPAIRDHLGASTLEMSLYALLLSAGSMIGLAIAGRVIARWGARRIVLIGLIAQASTMAAAGLALWIDQLGLGIVLLLLYGFAFSNTDVAINVSGAEAERALGKPRMPMYHGAYSLGLTGTVAIGAAAEAVKLPVPVHFSIMMAIVAGVSLAALRWIPRDKGAEEAEGLESTADGSKAAADSTRARSIEDRDATGSVITGPIPTVPADGSHPERTGAPAERRYNPWRDSRIYLIGLMTIALGLAEGSGTDWISLALVDGRGFTNSSATLVTGVYFTALVVTRFAGSALLMRFGRVTTVRGGALACALGLVLVILVPATWAIVLGTALWGAGCALGFPVAVSAAADDPKTAARSVAAVSVLSYSAYLVGPPMIGFLGEHFGLLTAFWPLVGVALLCTLVVGALRRPAHLDAAVRRG